MSDLFRSTAELTWLRKFGLTESAARRASLVLYPIDPRFPVEQAFANSAQELALEFARDSRRVTDGVELEAMAVEKLNVLMRFAWLFQNSDYVRIYGGALGRDFYFTDPRPVGDSLDRDDMFLFLDYVNNAEGESEAQLLKDVRNDPFLGRAYAEWSDEQLLGQLREIRSW
jgi:hypothetical protein